MDEEMATRSVLIIGAGGREHALAWKLAQSPQVKQIFVAPGNGGTDGGPDAVVRNVPVAVHDVDGLLGIVRREQIDLVVVGPEAPLALGVVDRLQAAGLRVFGPSQAAAQLETSKAFAKDFMWESGIPTASYAVFSEYAAALEYVRQAERPLVVKASGLAAGKGVLVCDTLLQAEQALFDVMQARLFGEAGDLVVVEERLSGPEVSLLAFTDGRTVVPMVAAQDHKRVFDGDLGPNTGGMGAYAPAFYVTPALLDEIVRTVLQPAVDGLAAQGTPYVGVLYAGLMLTPAGLRVLEFNARFGDPETQVILPLLATDLLAIIDACIDGRLADTTVSWDNGATATIVAASPGYPGDYPKGLPISGLDAANQVPGVTVFHAGTRRHHGDVLTDGGRVLAVTGTGPDLAAALGRAYEGIRHIHFEGMHYRRDIGAQSGRGAEL